MHYPEYFWLAYEWENLLFACDDCNDQGHKANLFPLVNPQQRATAVDKDIKREKPLILNPYGNSDPEKHIAWNRDVPRPRNGSRTGRVTIETFRLDQPSLLFTKRKDHFAETEGMLEAAEVLPPDEPVRIKVTAFLKVRASKRGAWSAMIRANLNERIAAL